MTSAELCQRFGITRNALYTWRRRHGFPPPFGAKRGPAARYGQIHVEWIEAWLAIHHHFVSGAEAVAFCRDNGISLREYLMLRERAVKDFGIGTA